MRKSRLESYEDILEALVNEPSILDHIAYALNTDCTVLRQRLDFLTKNGLVQKRTSSKRAVYAITEKGAAVLRVLDFQRYLGKVSNKIRVMDEALQIINKLEKDQLEKEKRTE